MTLRRNLLAGGLRLTLQSWPALVWTYLLNLGLAVFFSFPLQAQITAITAHSLAAQRLAGAFDLGTLAGVFSKLSDGPGPATAGSYLSLPVYLFLYFLIVPGTLVSYQTGASAQLFPLLQSGFAYFWRFVRITLVTVLIAGPILAGLNALQSLWSDHLDKHTLGRPGFLLGLAGQMVIVLVACLLRVYFDLMQVYTVQLGQRAAVPGQKPGRQRQIRRAFKPAWKALFGNFFRTYLTFVLLTVVGLGSVFFTARGAMHSLAQPRVLPIFLLAQIGLFLSLLTRFWQRGAETILALDNPLQVEAVVAPEPNIAEPEPAPELPQPEEVEAPPEEAPAQPEEVPALPDEAAGAGSDGTSEFSI
jgi:hypothetical protein